VLVTALVVIPPVTARQWTDRVGAMVPLAGVIGLVAALFGVAASAVSPRLPTGPLVVLAAAGLFGLSLLLAPRRGLVARWLRERRTRRAWAEGRVLGLVLAMERSTGACTGESFSARLPGGEAAAALRALLRAGAIEPVAGGTAWRLAARGRELALERERRLEVWTEVLESAREEARGHLSIDVPAPEAVLDAARLQAIREAAAAGRAASATS